MNSEDGQVCSVCILQFSCFTKYNSVCSQNINKQNVNIADETLIYYNLVGITILNQRIIWKDDIEFVTEFPCLLGHPVHKYIHTYIQYTYVDYIYTGWPKKTIIRVFKDQ